VKFSELKCTVKQWNYFRHAFERLPVCISIGTLAILAEVFRVFSRFLRANSQMIRPRSLVSIYFLMHQIFRQRYVLRDAENITKWATKGTVSHISWKCGRISVKSLMRLSSPVHTSSALVHLHMCLYNNWYYFTFIPKFKCDLNQIITYFIHHYMFF